MLRIAVAFLLIALIAGLFGFGAASASFIEMARILFFVFLALSVLAFVGFGYRRRT